MGTVLYLGLQFQFKDIHIYIYIYYIYTVIYIYIIYIIYNHGCRLISQLMGVTTMVTTIDDPNCIPMDEGALCRSVAPLLPRLGKLDPRNSW